MLPSPHGPAYGRMPPFITVKHRAYLINDHVHVSFITSNQLNVSTSLYLTWNPSYTPEQVGVEEAKGEGRYMELAGGKLRGTLWPEGLNSLIDQRKSITAPGRRMFGCPCKRRCSLLAIKT